MVFFKKVNAKALGIIAKRHSEEGEANLQRLRTYIDTEEPQTVLWLQTLWNNQQQAITYKELREAIVSGVFDGSWLEHWQKDYANLVNAKLAPQWMEAMTDSAETLKKQFPYFLYNPMTPSVQEFISEHGAEFITNMATEQKEAIQALISRAGSYSARTADELSREIRPLIGLTKQQATANLNHYAAVFNNLHVEMGLSKAAAEKRARDSSLRYAAKQHRSRAYTIARFELAFAYNAGAYSSTKKAQEEGYLGVCVKKWLTADDERVCKICGALDETAIEMDSNFEFKGKELFAGSKRTPPAHPGCRCSVIYEEISEPILIPEPKTDILEEKVTPFEEYKRYKNSYELPATYASELDKLTVKQKDALTFYTGMDYRGINNHYRKGAKFQNNSQKTAATQLNKAFREVSLPADTVLFRGMHPSTLLGFDKLIKLPLEKWVGKTFKDKAFLSTSIVEGENFSGEIQLEIYAAEGTKGIYISPISHYKSEQEVLLARGTKFKVIAAEQYGGKYHVKVAVVQEKKKSIKKSIKIY